MTPEGFCRGTIFCLSATTSAAHIGQILTRGGKVSLFHSFMLSNREGEGMNCVLSTVRTPQVDLNTIKPASGGEGHISLNALNVTRVGSRHKLSPGARGPPAPPAPPCHDGDGDGGENKAEEPEEQQEEEEEEGGCACTATAAARRVGTICQHPASRVSRHVCTRIPLLKQCGAKCACVCV